MAKIERTFLGIEDHGILTGWLHVSYGASGQGVGGYHLGGGKATMWLERVLSACGVDSWEQVRGRTVYVLRDDDDRIIGIEPLPTEPGKKFLFADLST